MTFWHQLLLNVAMCFAMLASGCYSATSTSDKSDTAIRPASGLAVEIRTGTGVLTDRGHYSVIICFHNGGTDSVFILKALDGSMRGRHMPYYKFDIRDEDRKPIKPTKDCGNYTGLYSESSWPKDYLVEIKPDANFEIEEAVPFQIEKDGQYFISFEYEYLPQNEQFVPPLKAWRGSVKSPEVKLQLKLQAP